MINIEKVSTMDKENLHKFSKDLKTEDISQLVNWLAEKENKLRYHSLLLLEYRSEEYNDVYPFWNTFCEKLGSINSYHRGIGVILISANVKWDKENKIDTTIDDYLKILNDEKLITVRQCIQSLNKIVAYKAHLHNKIANELMSINIMDVKPTMRKLILLDTLNILIAIERQNTSEEIHSYILQSFTGGILDKKDIKGLGFI